MSFLLCKSVIDDLSFDKLSYTHYILQLSEVVFICTVNLKETRTLLYTEKIQSKQHQPLVIQHKSLMMNVLHITIAIRFFFFNNLSNIQIRILLFIITFIHVLNRRVNGIYFRLKYNTYMSKYRS